MVLVGRGRFVLLLVVAPVAALIAVRGAAALPGHAASAVTPPRPAGPPVPSPRHSAPEQQGAGAIATDVVARPGVGRATVAFLAARPAESGVTYTVTATRV